MEQRITSTGARLIGNLGDERYLVRVEIITAGLSAGSSPTKGPGAAQLCSAIEAISAAPSADRGS